MQEYNLQRMLDGVDKDTSYMYNLMLNFTVPKGNRIGKSWNVDGFTWYEELLDILGVTKEYSDLGMPVPMVLKRIRSTLVLAKTVLI